MYFHSSNSDQYYVLKLVQVFKIQLIALLRHDHYFTVFFFSN